MFSLSGPRAKVEENILVPHLRKDKLGKVTTIFLLFLERNGVSVPLSPVEMMAMTINGQYKIYVKHSKDCVKKFLRNSKDET